MHAEESNVLFDNQSRDKKLNYNLNLLFCSKDSEISTNGL